MRTCDLVAERVALGEPVGEADHVAGCARCQRTIALPARIATAHVDADPGVGFSARMTQGAQTKIVVRRRRRVAGGIAGTALASALGLVIVLRPSGDRIQLGHLDTAQMKAHPDQPTPEHKDHDDNSALDALVRLADVDSASHAGARWARIEQPLAPYRALVKGVKP